MGYEFNLSEEKNELMGRETFAWDVWCCQCGEELLEEEHIVCNECLKEHLIKNKKKQAIKKTYNAFILSNMIKSCEGIKQISSNWTGSGAEATIKDEYDGQLYHVSISPVKEGNHES